MQLGCWKESSQKTMKQGGWDSDYSKWNRKAQLPGVQLLRCQTLCKHRVALRLVPRGGTGHIEASQGQASHICTQSVKHQEPFTRFSHHMWMRWANLSDKQSFNKQNIKIPKHLPFYMPGDSYSSNKETLNWNASDQEDTFSKCELKEFICFHSVNSKLKTISVLEESKNDW